MIKLTKEDLESEVKGVSIRFPEKAHNKIKAQAALQGISKDELFFRICVKGCENYNPEEYQESEESE